MSQVLIVSSASHHIAQHCAEMDCNKAEYAQYWGYDYRCGAGFDHPLHPSYDKLRLIREGLATHDLVVSLGMDVCFTNYTKDIAALLPKKQWLGIAKEKDKLCCDIMLFRASPEAVTALDIIEARIAEAPVAEAKERLWEQKYIIELWQAGKLPCALLDEDALGSFAPEVHWWVSPENRSWQFGDLLVHIPLKPWPERRDLFVKTYIQQIVK